MKRLLTTLVLSVAAVAHAQVELADGEVRKIDRAQQKVTLKHGEIKSLGMPPMTMTYRVRDAKLLDGLNEGDKVRFDAAKIDGNYTITTLQKAP